LDTWRELEGHSDSKWLKLAGNKFTQSDFTSFNKKCFCKFTLLPHPVIAWAIHIQICQIVAVAIMICQFHEFFTQVFGGFGPIVRGGSDFSMKLCFELEAMHANNLKAKPSGDVD
jgi:hypothetical protein